VAEQATAGAVFAASMMDVLRDAIDRAVEAERAACARIVLESLEDETIDEIAERIRGRG
jgi:hypothetical protein